MVTEGRREEVMVLEDTPDIYRDRLSQLQQLRKNRTFCDVVLQVGSSEIYAHRSVLACASPYFFELFTTDDENRTAPEEKLIYKLNGCFERDSVERLVSYAYTGQLEVPSSLVKAVFIAANKLKMDNIVKSCGEHLVANLTPDSCLSVRALPRIAANADLVERVDNYIQQQIDLLHLSRDTLGVPKILLKVVHVSKDEAAITSRALCTLCIEWLKKQIEEEEIQQQSLSEKEHLLYLNLDNSLHDCSEIQTGSMNDTELVQDYKRISRKKSQPCMKVRRKSNTNPVKPRMLLYSRSISDNDVETQEDWKLIAHSKVAESFYIAIVTLKGTVTLLSIQQHVPSSTCNSNASSRPSSVERVDSYTLIPNMRSPKCACGTGNFNGQLIVCGGYDRGECLREVEAYNPEANGWQIMAPMLESRGRFDLTVLNGRVYAVGGSSGSKELESVEIFDSETSSWSYAAPLPLARSNTGVCSVNEKVYCIGGWNGHCGIKRCDVYDPCLDKWDSVAALHVGRYQAGVVSLGGKAYAVGGCDSWNCLSSLECYDPELDVWKRLSSMTTPRRGCGAVICEGKLFVMGGSDGMQSLCSTEIYDPEENTWTAGPPMTTCRANVGAAVIEGKIYAVGGFSGKTFLNSIEILDPETMEWTNFTQKPEAVKPKDHNLIEEEANGGMNGKLHFYPDEEEQQQDLDDDFRNSMASISLNGNLRKNFIEC